MTLLFTLLACTGAGDTEPPTEDVEEDTDTDADTHTDTEPAYGPLVIEQLYLTGDDLGEAALIIGPDGTVVLLDTGNAIHVDAVLEALDQHVGAHSVDWVLLTHWHEDHVGAFAGLFGPEGQVAVSGGVLSRGPYDLGRGSHEDAWASACTELESGRWDSKHVELCAGEARATCDLSGTGPWAASTCDGLYLGEVGADGGDGDPTWIDLGDGARIDLFAVNGFLAVAGEPRDSELDGVDIGVDGNDDENARSIGGLVRYGDFTYFFGGDITGGGGASSPDVETWIVQHADSLGTDGLVASGEADVLHVHHHAFHSGTNPAWVDWTLPEDGLDRNAVIGRSTGHGDGPAPFVLDRLDGRLGKGRVYATQAAEGHEHPAMDVTNAHVVLEVAADGTYTVAARDGDERTVLGSYVSTP